MHKRHDLLWVDGEGRRQCLRTAQPLLADATGEQVEALLCNPAIPAIVSRQEERRDGLLQAGFASPEKYEGNRLRVAVLVALERIEKTTTPFQVAELIARTPDFPRFSLLDALLDAAKRHGLALGFFGSTALQAMTGLPYCGAESDVDAYVKAESASPDLAGFYRAATDLEKESGIRIDVEVEYREVFGIKLKEIFSGRKTVLAKGLYSVELIPASELGFSIGRGD